jgi:hypothetical protein
MLDIRFGLPGAIHDLTDEERAGRTRLTDDFAVLDDNRFYVRGLLELPIPELESHFGYGVWLEIEQPDFAHLLKHWKDPDQSEFPGTPGLLANELEPYAPTNGLRVLLQPVSADLLPSVAVLDAAHPLAIDQQSGISGADSDRLASTVLHQ